MKDELAFEVYGNSRDELGAQAKIGAENYYGKNTRLEIELSVSMMNIGEFVYHANVWVKPHWISDQQL